MYPREGEAADTPPAELMACAAKEFYEELGIGPVGKYAGHVAYRDGNFTYVTFVRRVDARTRRWVNGHVKLNWENDDARWFTIPEALALPNLHFGARYVLERLT
jgi:8-oxo-dGTP pyrophosphatase MutT (NUDIX family)